MRNPTTYDERQLAEVIAYCVGFSLLVSTIIFLVGYIIVLSIKSDILLKALFFNPLFWIVFAANANLGAMIGKKMVQRKPYIDKNIAQIVQYSVSVSLSAFCVFIASLWLLVHPL